MIGKRRPPRQSAHRLRRSRCVSIRVDGDSSRAVRSSFGPSSAAPGLAIDRSPVRVGDCEGEGGVVGEGAVVGGDGDEWSFRCRCSRGCRSWWRSRRRLSVKLAQAGSPVTVNAGMVRSGSEAVTVRVKGSFSADRFGRRLGRLTGGRLVLVTVRVKVVSSVRVPSSAVMVTR